MTTKAWRKGVLQLIYKQKAKRSQAYEPEMII